MKRPKGSIQVYQTCLKHLTGYKKARRKKLGFDNITEAFKNDFIAYLFSFNFTDTHVHKILTTLKIFLNDAYKRGVCDQNITAKVKLTIPKKEIENIYLNEREIQILYNMKDLGERLTSVRDLFLIGCLTGLRFSDYGAIQPENIRKIEHNGKQVPCLVITTQKTKQKVIIPLVNPMLKAIIKKNDFKAPKVISNQKLNKYLKELAKIAGFHDPIEVNEYRGGRHEKKVYQKWEMVSTHTARRSFATNAYKQGLPIADIMKFTGHKSVTSFMKYIKVTGEEVAVVLSDHEFFTGKSKLKIVG